LAGPDGRNGMTPAKRAFDIALALIGVIVFAAPLLLIAAALLASHGRPIFYVSERMKTPEDAFRLWKFRTMRGAAINHGVSGGDKAARITRMGHVLRRTRLDELPQLWNILRGDVSFVGPRPPLRHYVERFPQLYARVLQSRPGLTGLATLMYHTREERLLAACATADETDAVYAGRCIPCKARLDLIYQRKQTLLLDIFLLVSTVLRLFKRIDPLNYRFTTGR
jgi:lipopolysaccharide/colanic/teichoic acid biosynthesis glycosyltransferase